MPYVCGMEVIFNFPDLVSFRVHMDCVPREREIIKLYALKYNDFPVLKDYHKFADGDYKSHTWLVSRVVWTPRSEGGSYVNIILTKAPTYSVDDN